MKNEFITQIIQDFDDKTIPSFFDSNLYTTDHEISRHFFKFLRIGYIKKEDMSDPSKAIYINFEGKQFSISISRDLINVEKNIFKDNYQNYSSPTDVYNKLVTLCNNEDVFLKKRPIIC